MYGIPGCLIQVRQVQERLLGLGWQILLRPRGPDEIDFAWVSMLEITETADKQWRRALGTGAAVRASTDKPRSRGESYSDSSESAEKAFIQGTGAGIGGSGVRITLGTMRGSVGRRITREIGLYRLQKQEKTTFAGRLQHNKQGNKGKVRLAPPSGILGSELISWVLANEYSSFLPRRGSGLGPRRARRQEQKSWVPRGCRRLWPEVQPLHCPKL